MVQPQAAATSQLIGVNGAAEDVIDAHRHHILLLREHAG
jgi:hypothetical protein